MKAVIFAGGIGTRLWPLSRKKSPKQFEKIVGDKSTLQLAAERLMPDFGWDDLYVSTGKQYVQLVRNQLSDMPPSHVIGEPATRDVGPAVGLITTLFESDDPDEPMVILWSDHLVRQEKKFREILTTAGELIRKHKNSIVFVSQKPRFASVNLGWIEYGNIKKTIKNIAFHSFEHFKYRPDEPTATMYYTSGHHAWNLGYFVTTPRFLWKLYQKHAPELSKILKKIQKAYHTPEFERVLDELYPTLPKISFDEAILEKMDPNLAYVVSDNIEWSDVGAWEALKEALEQSNDKNVTLGKTMLTDTIDSLVYNYTDQMVVAIDCNELLVVNTDDVVLVCNKKSVPKIKKFVESLSGTEHENLA